MVKYLAARANGVRTRRTSGFNGRCSIKGYASSKKLDIVNTAPFSCSQFSNSDLPHIIKKEKRLHNYKY